VVAKGIGSCLGSVTRLSILERIWVTIMHDPLPITHRKGVILGYLQTIHHLRSRYHLPACDDSYPTIRPQDVYARCDLAHRQEAVFQGEERVLLVGMDHLARLCDLITRPLCGGDGQVHQVVVVVDPHVQDGLEDEMEKRTAESILKSLSAYAYAFIALFSDKQKEGYFVA